MQQRGNHPVAVAISHRKLWRDLKSNVHNIIYDVILSRLFVVVEQNLCFLYQKT